jgi:hypothetical protein
MTRCIAGARAKSAKVVNLSSVMGCPVLIFTEKLDRDQAVDVEMWKASLYCNRLLT